MTAVSVVIPTYNRAASLGRLLDSLLAASSEVDELEVLVSDDGSTDDTRAVIRASGASPIHVVGTNGGPAAARNRGWRAASHEVVLFIDDDCLLRPGSLAGAVEAVRELDAVGGDVVPASGRHLLEVFTEVEGLVKHKVVDGEVRYLVTACLAAKRQALEAVDGFDEQFRHGGEDADLTMTLMERGYRVGVSDAFGVVHAHRTGFLSLVRTYYRHGTGQQVLLSKHPARRAGLGTSVRQRLSLRAWIGAYRTYRAETGRARSAACIALRALMMIPWLVGARVGSRPSA